METALLVFVGFVAIILVILYIALRRAIASVLEQVGSHAKTYSLAYVKGGALILVTMLASFKESFHALTFEMAEKLAWWDWAILFFGPIASGLAVLVAFLDRSIPGSPPPPQAPEKEAP